MGSRSDDLDRLAATNPLPQGTRVDPAMADRLRASIVAQPRRPTRPPWISRRPLVVAAVVIAVTAIAGPTLAFSDGVRSFLGWESLPVFEKSRLLVSAPVAESTVAHLWGSPSRRGGECFFVTFGTPGKVERPSRMTGGGSCSLGPRSRSGSSMPLSLQVPTVNTAPPGAAAGVPPILTGYVDPSLGATRVELRWTGGSKELAYANGYFLGGVMRALFDAPKEVIPIRVIAYDAKGREVHRIDLDAAWFRID
jgi:hypothetical protein